MGGKRLPANPHGGVGSRYLALVPHPLSIPWLAATHTTDGQGLIEARNCVSGTTQHSGTGILGIPPPGTESSRIPLAAILQPGLRYPLRAATGAVVSRARRQGPMHGTCELAPPVGDTYLVRICVEEWLKWEVADSHSHTQPEHLRSLASVSLPRRSGGSSVWCSAESGDSGTRGTPYTTKQDLVISRERWWCRCLSPRPTGNEEISTLGVEQGDLVASGGIWWDLVARFTPSALHPRSIPHCHLQSAPSTRGLAVSAVERAV